MTDAPQNAARHLDSCPPTEVLEQLLADTLAEPDAAAVQEHVDHCPHCLAELERLSGHAEVQRLAAAVGALPSRDLEISGLDHLVRKLRETHSESSLTSTAAPGIPAALVAPLTGGRYHPLRFHRRGGLGEVFVAEDAELHREVALKCMQARHVHHADNRRRFLREAEITAQLEHPGIVPVHGLVEDPNGQPYYAMRFVQGDTLHQAIQRFHEAGKPGRSLGERSLTLRQLLTRFVAVCNTIAYAHSRGIIHRDLKPNNILLGEYGETLVVDWGLAKAVHRDDLSDAVESEPDPPNRVTTNESETAPGAAMGTPAYMSPEQAAGQWDRVGPPSDIYSLGATLYMLLTGQPPFSGDVNLERVQRGDFAPPRQVKREAPAALEAVCLKAMAGQPEGRYVSASELAADVEHWLADERVSSYREPWRTRLGRWLRRHPATTAAGAVGLSAMVVVAVVVAVLSEQGRQAVDAQRQRAEEAASAEQVASATAQKRLWQIENGNRVITAIIEELTAIIEDLDIRQITQGSAPLEEKRTKRLVNIAEHLEGDEVGDPLVVASLLHRIGVTLVRHGHPENAIPRLRKVRETRTAKLGPDHPDTLRSMNNLAVSYYALRQHIEALKIYEETLALQKGKLGPDHPDTLRSMMGLASCYHASSRYGAALKVYEETLTLQKGKLGPDHPDTLQCMVGLAGSYAALGRPADALKVYEETLGLQKGKFEPDHRDTLQCMLGLASSYYALGRYAEALKVYEETLALQKGKLGLHHPDTLRSMMGQAASHAKLDRPAEAVKGYEATLALQKGKLGPGHPDTLQCMGNLAVSYTGLGRHVEALKLREETLRLQSAKLGLDHRSTLLSMNNLANSHIALRRSEEAVKLLQEALDHWQKQAGQPSNLQAQLFLAWTQGQLGQAEEVRQQFAVAAQAYSQALECFDQLDQAGKLKDAFFRSQRDFFRLRFAICQKAEQAVADLEFALQQPSAEVPGLLHARLWVLLTKKDRAGVVATAAAWQQLSEKDAEQGYAAAAAWSLASQLLKKEKDHGDGVAKVLTLLRHALEAKKPSPTPLLLAWRLEQDPDFAPLRSQPAFDAFIKELHAAEKAVQPQPLLKEP